MLSPPAFCAGRIAQRDHQRVEGVRAGQHEQNAAGIHQQKKDGDDQQKHPGSRRNLPQKEVAEKGNQSARRRKGEQRHKEQAIQAAELGDIVAELVGPQPDVVGGDVDQADDGGNQAKDGKARGLSGHGWVLLNRFFLYYSTVVFENKVLSDNAGQQVDFWGREHL